MGTRRGDETDQQNVVMLSRLVQRARGIAARSFLKKKKRRIAVNLFHITKTSPSKSIALCQAFFSLVTAIFTPLFILLVIFHFVCVYESLLLYLNYIFYSAILLTMLKVVLGKIAVVVTVDIVTIIVIIILSFLSSSCSC